MSKLIAISFFCFFLVSTCFCSNIFGNNQRRDFSYYGSGSGSASAGSPFGSASGSASGGLGGTLGGVTSIAQPVLGIVNMPLQYVGVITQTVNGLLGALLPGLSLVANINGNLLNLGTSSISASAFAQNGATVNITISLPACGLLRVVGSIGVLQPVITIVADLLSLVTNLLGSITGALTSSLKIGNTLGIVCAAAPGCQVSLRAIALNGIKVSDDLNLLGGGNLVNNQMSVLITNELLTSCNFVITAQLSVYCPVGQVVDSITGCNFLFGILGGATGGLLGGLLG